MNEISKLEVVWLEQPKMTNGLSFVNLSHIGGLTKLEVVYKEEHSLYIVSLSQTLVGTLKGAEHPNSHSHTRARVAWAMGAMWSFDGALCTSHTRNTASRLRAALVFLTMSVWCGSENGTGPPT